VPPHADAVVFRCRSVQRTRAESLRADDRRASTDRSLGPVKDAQPTPLPRGAATTTNRRRTPRSRLDTCGWTAAATRRLISSAVHGCSSSSSSSDCDGVGVETAGRKGGMQVLFTASRSVVCRVPSPNRLGFTMCRLACGVHPVIQSGGRDYFFARLRLLFSFSPNENAFILNFHPITNRISGTFIPVGRLHATSSDCASSSSLLPTPAPSSAFLPSSRRCARPRPRVQCSSASLPLCGQGLVHFPISSARRQPEGKRRR
jgi:hypothetical protein